MYLTADDFSTLINSANLAEAATIAEQNKALLIAEQALKDALYKSYNTVTEFAKTGTDRHQTLVDAGATIAAFKLLRMLPGRQLPDWLQQEYELTREMLRDISAGDIALPLERLSEESSPAGVFKRRFSTTTPRSL